MRRGIELGRGQRESGGPWSVLFGDGDAARVEHAEEPAYFGDLNLDQIVAAIAYRKEVYELPPFFYAPLCDVGAIRFRQQVFSDLERPEVRELADAFAARKLVGRQRSEQRSMRDAGDYAHHHRTRGFLNAVVTYCDAVERLTAALHATDVQSEALLGLRDRLDGYVAGEAFCTLRDDARALDVEVDRVRYSFLVRGLRITVGSYEERPDYSAEVAATFDRFRQTDRVDESAELRDWETYLPLGVLDLVARNHPDLFGRLDAFRERHRDYLDPTVELLDRELQFYLGYLVLVAEDRSLGREAIDKRDCFGDLHLDQIVAAAIANREEYQLDPFFQYDPAHGFYVADSPRSLFLRAGRDDEGERSYKITPGGTVADQLRRGLLPCRVRFRSRRVRLSEAHDAHVRPAEARVHTRLSSRRAVGREQIVTNRFPAQGGLPFRSCGAPAGGRRDGRLR